MTQGTWIDLPLSRFAPPYRQLRMSLAKAKRKRQERDFEYASARHGLPNN
jgi:hypothetical protein